MNQINAKCIEYMENLIFVLKHISGKTNKVADDLSRRCLILQECQVIVLGFDHLKGMYKKDLDFKEVYEACENPVRKDRSS